MTHDPKPMTLWLTLCAALVVCMVALGGYTRLSGSGLSITQWEPIHGAIPPLNDAQWQEEFERYQQIPQYRAINPDMTLEGFKQIFWPEFLHRLLGRIIGMVFIVPLVFFWWRGHITRSKVLKLLGIFSIGGLQGFMGWYMVSSGLSENIYVSHFRLAEHLGLALLLLGLIVWEIVDMSSPRRRGSIREWTPANLSQKGRAGVTLWFTLLCLQILYGALVAGLKAGLLYNSWPMMNGYWLPSDLNHAIFTHHTTVQFIHRWLAAVVAIGYGFWWFSARTYVKSLGVTKLAASVGGVIALQFVLGVLTLINAVPLALGMLHQLTAVVLFILAIILWHALSVSTESGERR